MPRDLEQQQYAVQSSRHLISAQQTHKATMRSSKIYNSTQSLIRFCATMSSIKIYNRDARLDGVLCRPHCRPPPPPCCVSFLALHHRPHHTCQCVQYSVLLRVLSGRASNAASHFLIYIQYSVLLRVLCGFAPKSTSHLSVSTAHCTAEYPVWHCIKYRTTHVNASRTSLVKDP